MEIWALADLHLAIAIPSKTMEVFGEEWQDYMTRIRTQWQALIRSEDLVLLPGDISWAMSPEQAIPDLEWVDALPGTKVMIKGNHDYWWGSLAKTQKVLPPSLHLIQNNAFDFQEVSVAGARLWDTNEYTFDALMNFRENPLQSKHKQEETDPEKIFVRELERLELSLKSLRKEAKVRIAMTHYPPIGLDLHPSRVSTLLEQYQVSICVFGHLHNVKKGISLFGSARGVAYHLTSADYLEFLPLKIYSSAK